MKEALEIWRRVIELVSACNEISLIHSFRITLIYVDASFFTLYRTNLPFSRCCNNHRSV